MNLHPQCLYIIRSISPLGKISQIQLDLIPALIHSQWHCADVWFHSSDSLHKEILGTTSLILIHCFLVQRANIRAYCVSKQHKQLHKPTFDIKQTTFLEWWLHKQEHLKQYQSQTNRTDVWSLNAGFVG